MPRHVDITIPKSPPPPFPLTIDYVNIVCGFGRGSSDLGIPTANISLDQLPPEVQNLNTGIYFGWCRLKPTNGYKSSVQRKDGTSVEFNNGCYLIDTDLEVLPMVLSLGLNPFYKNQNKILELHIIHKFDSTFYGAQIKFSFLGYIRPELDYTTKEDLIKDINLDIHIAKKILDTEPYKSLKINL